MVNFRRRAMIGKSKSANEWTEVAYERHDGRNYNATGSYAGNSSYASIGTVQTNGKTEWKVLCNMNVTNNTYKRCQLFNGTEFLKAVYLTKTGTEEYNGATLYCYTIPEIETATGFRFHIYPKKSLTTLIILAK